MENELEVTPPNIPLEDNIPLPSFGNRSVFRDPVEAMEVGQSFVFNRSEIQKVRNVASAVQGSTEKRFTQRKIGPDMFRLWRIK